MKLYLKIIQFIKPFWKLVVVAIFLTFFYVIFNNISLWVSVDFIRELFTTENQLTQVNDVVADSSSVSGKENKSTQQPDAGLIDAKSKNNLYKDINSAIKRIIIQKDKYDTLKVVCLVIFFSFLLKNISLYFKKVVVNFIQLKIINNIRNKLHNVMLHLPLSFFEKRHSGDLTSIVFNDVNSVNNVLRDSFGNMLLTPIQVISNLVILILISWKLSLITFTIVPVSGLLIVKIGQSIRRKSRRVFLKISGVVSVFQETISGIRIVKAFTAESKEISFFEKANAQYFKVLFRKNNLNFATSPLNETLGILILVSLLWYGGGLVYSNAGLAAEDFIRYLLFLFAMFQPLKDLSGLNNSLQTGFAAAERIFNVIDMEQEIYNKPGARELTGIHNSIRYSNINFRYNETDKEVLHDVNLEIKRGETVAFVGHSGSGKTTLVNLLPRFYELQHGRIEIDGVDVHEYTLHSLRKQMGIVTQDSILFNDTVRANIAYGVVLNTPEHEIIAAAKAANAWEFIEKMDNKLDTMIGERGVNLSGGQKQRISIARAILKNPPILILDEATSALDTESEKLVQEAIDKLMRNRTVLVIAHRLSTVIHADKIIVVNKGKIMDSGTHRELLKSCPIYKQLYEMQFRDENEPSENQSPIF